MFKKSKFLLIIVTLLLVSACSDKDETIKSLENKNSELTIALAKSETKLETHESQDSKTRNSLKQEYSSDFREKLEDEIKKSYLLISIIAIMVSILLAILYVQFIKRKDILERDNIENKYHSEMENIKNKYNSEMENIKNKYNSELDIIKSKYEKDRYTLDRELEGFRNNKNLQEEEIQTRIELGKELQKIKTNLELNFDSKDMKND